MGVQGALPRPRLRVEVAAGDHPHQYGLRANEAGTYLATFRGVVKKYPHKTPSHVLADLVATTPGDEGKWFADTQPAFAAFAGLLSLHWLVLGYGYEITGADVMDAYRATMAAAERQGASVEVKRRVGALVATERSGGFVRRVLGRELGM